MFAFDKIKNEKAFTLVDLLVSISIIAIISTLMFADFHKYGQDSKLESATQELASNIRFMQNNALSLSDFNGASARGGWGIFMCHNESKYILFANIDLTGSDIDDECEYGVYDSATETFKEFSLPSNVTFNRFLLKELPPSFTLTNKNCAHVLFIPPEPKTCIVGFNNDNMSGALNNQGEVEITLQDTKTGAEKKIIVNAHGLIDIQN